LNQEIAVGCVDLGSIKPRLLGAGCSLTKSIHHAMDVLCRHDLARPLSKTLHRREGHRHFVGQFPIGEESRMGLLVWPCLPRSLNGQTGWEASCH